MTQIGIYCVVAKDDEGPRSDGILGSVCTYRTQAMAVIAPSLQRASDLFLEALESQSHRAWSPFHAMRTQLGALSPHELVLVSADAPVGPPSHAVCAAGSLRAEADGRIRAAANTEFQVLGMEPA